MALVKVHYFKSVLKNPLLHLWCKFLVYSLSQSMTANDFSSSYSVLQMRIEQWAYTRLKQFLKEHTLVWFDYKVFHIYLVRMKMYNSIKKKNSILENFSTHCGFRLVWNESKIAISSAEHDFACVNSIELNFSLFASLNQINSMVWEPYSKWVKINSEGAFVTFTRYFIKFDTIFWQQMGSDKITYWIGRYSFSLTYIRIVLY